MSKRHIRRIVSTMALYLFNRSGNAHIQWMYVQSFPSDLMRKEA